MVIILIYQDGCEIHNSREKEIFDFEGSFICVRNQFLTSNTRSMSIISSGLIHRVHYYSYHVFV